jgi:histone deacetylase 11
MARLQPQDPNRPGLNRPRQFQHLRGPIHKQKNHTEKAVQGCCGAESQTGPLRRSLNTYIYPMKRPIVFSPRYDITLFGIEKAHPFDSAKYGKVFKRLVADGLLDGQNHYLPPYAEEADLRKVHTADYLASLYKSAKIAGIAEVYHLRYLPNFILQWRFMTPMRYATGGTVLGAGLALEHGWAINLAGGYHHAKAAFGSGFCFFADINLAAQVVWERHPELKVMVIDLDAHQGNGFASTFGDEPRVALLDVYNGDIYPHDQPARKFVRYDRPIASSTKTAPYLQLIQDLIPSAVAAEKPGLIIYNAGTDIYEKDPLGALSISAAGITARDELVFRTARNAGIPILMVLSGGYTQESHRLIADSILNLSKQGLLP